MKQSLLLFALCFGLATQAQNNFKYLDINNVRAGVTSQGGLHYNPANNSVACEVPAGSGQHSSFFTNLWFAGMNNNQLHLAVQLHPQLGTDFNAGPLNTSGATNATDSATYTKVWKLNRTDITDFLANFANGNVQNGSYVPVPDLLSWPGNGNIQNGEDLFMAPFFDVDNDGIYNPVHSGDYPLIKGDQALFFVYNDETTGPHASGGQAFGLEIRCMAYAYAPCSVSVPNNILNYTTFYEYKIINRSNRIYTNFYAGLHTEADLGQYADDYIGCNVPGNYGYVYNGDSNDETANGSVGYGLNPPAAAYVMLKPVEDLIDNDNDGMVDEPGEDLGMTGFSYFKNSGPTAQPGTLKPTTAQEYYNYLKGDWKDGTPLSCNTPDGYGGSLATAFAFPGATDPSSACGPANWVETASPGDRRYIMSSGPHTIMPGSIIFLEYAHVTSFPGSANVLAKLDQDVNDVQQFYNSRFTSACSLVGMTEQEKTQGFSLYPNPATSEISLSFGNAMTANIEVTDVYGKTVLSDKTVGQEKMTINTSELASGIYFVKVSAEGRSTTVKFIKLYNH